MKGRSGKLEGSYNAVQSIGRRGEITTVTPEDWYDGRDQYEQSNDPHESTRNNGDSEMQVPQQDKEAGKEECQGDLEKDRQDCDNLLDAPFDEMIQPVLSESCDLHRFPRYTSLVLVKPLFHQNAD